MIVKMIVLRLLGSSDDKEKIGVARPEGPPLRGFRITSYRVIEFDPHYVNYKCIYLVK